MGISVIIPVYNSERTIPDLVRRLHGILNSIDTDYELILVNDCSTDNSWETICGLANRHGWIRGFNLMRNFGQHNALLCGIRAAIFEFIVTMDDDLQHPPEEIPRLLSKLNEGFDVVYGKPRDEKHDLWRRLGSYITKIALRTSMGVETAFNASAFRVFRTQIRDAFATYQNSFVSIDALLTWGTNRFASVTVQHNPRQTGTSNYNVFKLITHALNMITSYSIIPLQIAGLLGFIFTAFGVGVLSYVVGRYLIQGTSVAGFPFLASIIAIFSGVQLFSIGIIGEYFARIHSRIMDKPAYIISQDTTAQPIDSQPGAFEKTEHPNV